MTAAASTSTPSPSPYFFCLCQEGVEPQLRKELTALGFAPSFQDKGFVSAKSERPLTVDTLPRPVLARRVCLHLTKRKLNDGESVAAACAAAGVDVDGAHGAHGAHVHGVVDDAVVGADAAEGDVVTTFVVHKGQLFVGAHRQRVGLSPAPLGDPRLVVPAEAPSRAWLKLEEAARQFVLPIADGDVVVEVGCAPGGVSRALLDRGAVVVGVDPNAMDPRILAEPRFTHLRVPAQRVALVELLRPARFFVVDVNQRPHAAISSVEHLVWPLREELSGALFTLKVGDWEHLGEIPRWRRRLEQLLLMKTMACQLPSNRQEICVFCYR